MWINVRFNLDPKDPQSRELIELLKQLAETELDRRHGRSSNNPIDWMLDATHFLFDWLIGVLGRKARELAVRVGLVKGSDKDGLPQS